MSLVSIIIPYYKKDYILESVNSVLNQTYQNFEIIIIYDDGDKTELPFINDIKKKDDRIKIFLNHNNLGAGLSRNKGIELSKGEYIAFLDADDYWNNEKLDKQINFMKNNNFFISHTSYNIFR